MALDIEQLLTHFEISGAIGNIQGFGSGHINDTFKITNASPGEPDYLLQRINHKVFPHVGPMMDNILRVTEHLKKKENPEYHSMTIVPTRTGDLFIRDDNGSYWRVYIFLEKLVSYDVVETSEQIYEGGKAFGTFLRDLSDFPAETLFPTLPNFHHVPMRVRNLERAVKDDKAGRVLQANHLIRFALEVADEMCRIQALGDQHQLPLRVTHNDTKFNNVMLDRNGKGRCVIDLDTVMPGYVHFDFGDAVRTSVSSAPEDETDLEKIQVDLDRFEAFARGYLEPSRDILSPLELEYLPLSGAMLAYIMGIRFLTDFLMGDVYYKIHSPEHNLQRATAQLDLTQKILNRIPDLKRMI
ncbi:phosphotransferase enzyme family protein [Flavilitoribacter nigricans]|nr:aminoglycoside phosphotransferase family protein [Flavilitoribacter nigricans]